MTGIETFATEVVVVGGGVVGLAIARDLAAAGREVLLIEENPRFGEETSSRNNQVIHAGFLYPQGSLKAALCKPGRDALVNYCRERDVPHRIVPKLMPVQSEAELPLLDALVEQGRCAGVNDLEIIGGAELARIEPSLRAPAALLSPSTGIVDAATLISFLEADAAAAGVTFVPATRVEGGNVGQPCHSLSIRSADGTESLLQCAWLINAAGLGAAPLAAGLSGFPQQFIPEIHFAKGQFLSHRGAVPFRHLVVPVGASLAAGASLTFDPSGQVRFGPDLSFANGRDYSITAEVPATAVEAIARLWPGLDPTRLAPEFSGIRPRVTGPGEPPGDWRIDGPDVHGIDGLIHLFGIDTPGLTACLALAGLVADHVRGVAPSQRRASI